MNKTEKKSRWAWIIYALLAFGILISGPRFSGAFAAAIGIDLIGSGYWWAWIEIMSGWALGLFEACAFAFIAYRFRRIQILDDDPTKPLSKRIIPANAIYWVILLCGQLFLLFSIPAVVTVHLATQIFKVKTATGTTTLSVPEVLTWSNLINHHLTWIWLFVTASASTLFVFLLGLVIDDFGVLGGSKEEKGDVQVYKAYTRLRKYLPIIDPQSLAKEAGISVKEAADFLDNLAPSTILEPVPVKDPLQSRLQSLKQRSNPNGNDNT